MRKLKNEHSSDSLKSKNMSLSNETNHSFHFSLYYFPHGGGGGGRRGEGHDEGEEGGESTVAGGSFRGDGGIAGGGVGTGSTKYGSRGDAMCTGPAIGVQQLGLQRRQQLNSLVTDDP